jgi:uncharacterized protein
MRKEAILKLGKLKKILKDMGSVLVAYSGGVDSSFLLKVAKDVLGDNLLAVTAVSPTYPKRELREAKEFIKTHNIKHLIIKTSEYKNPLFIKNNYQRCYWCKRELFLKLKKIAQKQKINYVVDGTNFDDQKDFRPGEKAKKELGVRSPLKEAKIKKDEIRLLSKKLGLNTYKKPSGACLASRIAYGNKITLYRLKRIERAEDFLRNLGFSQVRLRDYSDLARIEVDKEKIPFLITNRLKICNFLKKLKFIYVTLDLEGYRQGSMNLVLRRR